MATSAKLDLIERAQPPSAAASPPAAALPRLVRPQFFHGQLLTDADLGAGLSWTQARLGLARYRAGWGVVCGLEVHADPQHAGCVVVGPGYALSSRGQELVLAQASAPYDLVGACQISAEPCAKLRKEPPASGTEKQAFQVGGYSLAPEQVRAIDLFIRYAEQPFDLQPALGRSAWPAGAGESVCAPSRTRETCALDARLVEDAAHQADALQAAASDWQAGYMACYEQVLHAYNNHAGSIQPVRSGEQTRVEWLKAWVAAHPLQVFRFAEQAIGKLAPAAGDPQIAEALFWIVQDRRVIFLNQLRGAAPDGGDVPLARAWLGLIKSADGRSAWTVQAIDQAPPFRRPLSPDLWPAPLGMINLGQFVWRRWVEVRRELAALGLRVERELKLDTPPASVAELMELLLLPDPKQHLSEVGEARHAHGVMFADDSRPLRVQILNAGRLGQQVVGFAAGAAAAKSPGS